MNALSRMIEKRQKITFDILENLGMAGMFNSLEIGRIGHNVWGVYFAGYKFAEFMRDGRFIVYPFLIRKVYRLYAVRLINRFAPAKYYFKKSRLFVVSNGERCGINDQAVVDKNGKIVKTRDMTEFVIKNKSRLDEVIFSDDGERGVNS